MAIIKPFRALRPSKDKAALVSAPSYDSGSRDRSYEELERNPHSYLHIVKPYLHFKGEKKTPEKHFPLGINYLNEFIEKGWLIRDAKPAYYIYRVIKGSQAYTGIIAAASVNDYLKDNILKHENTLTEKQNEVADHINWFNQMGNPVLLTYPDCQPVDEVIEHYIINHIPEYNFISNDQLKHNIWVVNDEKDMNIIANEFLKINKLYIADGHHRSAGAAANCLNKRAASIAGSGYEYFPVCLIPFSKLHIYEYHRLIKDSKVYEPEFLTELQKYFTLTPSGNLPVQPLKPKEFGIYFNKHAYLLKLKPEFENNLSDIDLLGKLDVSVAEHYIIKSVFGIEDSKTDKRISFLDGTKGIGTLQDMIDRKEFDIAITLYRTSIEEVKQVADAGLIMPPKSTWIEPKLRTGLIIYETNG